MRSLFRGLISITIVLALAQPSFADNKAAAREAFRRAQRHYNLAEYSDALADFKEAYRNYEDPSFLFNIAQCERALNHKPEAIRAYKTYLAATPNAPNRDDVSAIIHSLETALQEERAAASRPPQGTIGTAPSPEPHAEAQPTATTRPELTASTRAVEKTPVYKKWWLWTVVGGVAAVGLGVGLGVGLTGSGSPATASTSLGTLHPF